MVSPGTCLTGKVAVTGSGSALCCIVAVCGMLWVALLRGAFHWAWAISGNPNYAGQRLPGIGCPHPNREEGVLFP